MTLRVNEIFGPTIQGEGVTAGKQVLFLRLSGCNLHCIWCDTPYTWNWIGTKFAHPVKFDRDAETTEMSDVEIIERLTLLDEPNCKALVLSGGEPLLQQKNLLSLLTTLKEDGWWIEIETNGTIAPSDDLNEVVDQFNCSPKLSNSTNTAQQRIRPKALEVLAENEKVFFKFVISKEDDIQEVRDYINDFDLDKERVYLMPLGMTKDELKETRGQAQALATKLAVNFSDRLHVEMFGGKRAV